jgi:hypothetical protein
VEEILEMGIDGFWIGYEGTRSGYAKQQGRPANEILKEFRDHGITVLASMIVGFDYQTPEVVAQEHAGLMQAKPALAQFLIYGPVPGTPFHERVIKENLLHDIYTTDKDLFYRRADGFRTMMKHPTLSPEQIEDIQRWCFEQDFHRLGPSIYRVLEARLLGYQNSRIPESHPARKRRNTTPRELRTAYPVFLAGRLLGPNAAVRRWIGDLERRIHVELGQPTLGERARSGVLAVGAALWTALTLKLNWFQHPKLIRTTYRLPEEALERLYHVGGIPTQGHFAGFLHSGRVATREATGLDALEGALSTLDAEGLVQRISESLARSRSRLDSGFEQTALGQSGQDLTSAPGKAGGPSFAHPAGAAQTVGSASRVFVARQPVSTLPALTLAA